MVLLAKARNAEIHSRNLAERISAISTPQAGKCVTLHKNEFFCYGSKKRDQRNRLVQ